MAYDDHPDDEWVNEDEDAGDDLLVCPVCGKAVHEDTQQCPYCGDWIVPVYPGGKWKRAVWVVAAALVILSLLVVLL